MVLVNVEFVVFVRLTRLLEKKAKIFKNCDNSVSKIDIKLSIFTTNQFQIQK